MENLLLNKLVKENWSQKGKVIAKLKEIELIICLLMILKIYLKFIQGTAFENTFDNDIISDTDIKLVRPRVNIVKNIKEVLVHVLKIILLNKIIKEL